MESIEIHCWWSNLWFLRNLHESVIDGQVAYLACERPANHHLASRVWLWAHHEQAEGRLQVVLAECQPLVWPSVAEVAGWVVYSLMAKQEAEPLLDMFP